MKFNSRITSLLISILLIIIIVTTGFGETKVRSTGIGLRGGYWNLSQYTTKITVTDNGEHSSVHVGGVGGWLYVFSRFNDAAFFEISLGGIARVDGETDSYDDENVDVLTIMPLLIGLRYDLSSPTAQSGVRPYISFGAGPYWMSKVKVRGQYDDEEVTVENTIKRGGYVGGGFNFLLSSWFALNFDVKYHFINFNVKDPHSGFEYGLGINFSWGQYILQQ